MPGRSPCNDVASTAWLRFFPLNSVPIGGPLARHAYIENGGRAHARERILIDQIQQRANPERRYRRAKSTFGAMNPPLQHIQPTSGAGETNAINQENGVINGRIASAAK